MVLEEFKEDSFLCSQEVESKLLPGIYIKDNNFSCPLCRMVFNLACYGATTICACGYTWVRIQPGTLRIIKEEIES